MSHDPFVDSRALYYYSFRNLKPANFRPSSVSGSEDGTNRSLNLKILLRAPPSSADSESLESKYGSPVTELVNVYPTEFRKNHSDFDDLNSCNSSFNPERVSETPNQSVSSRIHNRREEPDYFTPNQPSGGQPGNEEVPSNDDMDLDNQLRKRLLPERNYLKEQQADQPDLSWTCGLSNSADLPEEEIVVNDVTEELIVNDMSTPPSPKQNSSSGSGPTPPEQRLLGQKEFDRKLNAKRDIFSKGRSISMGAFRMFRSPKKKKKERKRKDEEEVASHKPPVRGELELVNVDQLINVDDLS